VLLVETLPELADELQSALQQRNRLELAAQVRTLEIIERCRCGDDFCSSFYTQPKPEGSYGPGLETIELDAAIGMLILDVVQGKIAHVEVLNNDRNRQKLFAALP